MSDLENKDMLEEEEEVTILSVTDTKTGEEVKFELLDIVPYEGLEYLAVVPVDGSEDALELYRIIPDDENDTETYEGIESEEELEAVYQIFKERNQDLFNFEEE